MLSINLSPLSAHAVAARAAHEQKRVPSSDELIREIDKEIEKKGDLKIIRAATIRELDEIIEPSNELQKLWKKWQYFVNVDERLDKEITPTPNEEEELKKIHMILLNNIKFNQRKIAVLLSKICVNRDTNNKNVLHTRCPVKPDHHQTEASTLTRRLQNELRYRKPKEQPGLKETKFHQPERREYQWQKEINGQQTSPDIGTTIETKEAGRESITFSQSPVQFWWGKSLLFRSTPPGLY